MSGKPLVYEKTINGYKVILQMPSDFSEASMVVSLDNGAIQGDFPTGQQLDSFLKEEGIVLGIKNDILNNISNFKILDKSEIVAQQMPAQNGRDSQIKYIVDSTGLGLSQDEQGNIDFKELHWFKQVSKSDILAEKIPFTMGIDGYNIKGKKIYGQPGKDVAFKYGANVQISDDDLRLIATKSGRFENIDGKISVNDVLEINGDIDTSVGNLDFEGSISIKGDIKSGYTVRSKGSLEVNGVIESSIIEVDGDLVVKGGIKGGENTDIKVGGNLVCKFIENSKVTVYKDISTDFIIHSNVKSGGNIKLEGRKSMISGGEVTARDTITVATLGSHMATKTNIFLGIDIEKSEELSNKTAILEECESQIKKLIPQITIGKEQLQRGRMDTLKKIAFTKTLKEYSSYQEKIKELEDRIDMLEEELREFKNSYIEVKDRIYPGIKISIIDHSKYFSDQEGRCRVVMENGDVVVKKG